jgi:UDP:flavonoid glycosyltransferase YjiC (YdhE family)
VAAARTPPVEPSSGSARPLVYVTLGTMFSNTEVFRVILDGLALEDVDVLVTVGSDGDPAALDPLSHNASAARFVPQATVLPRCAKVDHHGGGGTTFGALAQGVPQVVVPQGADNFSNAERLEAAGAARTVLPDAVRAPCATRSARCSTIPRSAPRPRRWPSRSTRCRGPRS